MPVIPRAASVLDADAEYGRDDRKSEDSGTSAWHDKVSNEDQLKKRLLDDDSDSDESVVGSLEIEGPCCYLPMRYVVVLLSTACFMTCCAMQFAMGVAVSPGDDNSMYVEYKWSMDRKGVALSSFFWGYIATQILGGVLSTWFGPKIVLGLGMLLNCSFALLTPAFADAGFELLVVNRILVGMFQGVMIPPIWGLLASWSPACDRTTMVGIIGAGMGLGKSFGILTASIIQDHLGWRWIFYIYGSIGLAFLAMFTLLVTSRPVQSPLISRWELGYIVRTSSVPVVDKNIKTPWIGFLTSPAVWALLFNYFSFFWIVYFLAAEMPSFFNNVLKYKMSGAGIFAALPYLLLTLWVPLLSRVVDFLIKKHIVSTAVARKLIQTIAIGGSATSLVLTGFIHKPSFAVVSTTLIVLFNGSIVCGSGSNPLDIAPRYAGELVSICHTVATIPGIITPVLTSHALNYGRKHTDSDYEGDKLGYQVMFCVTAGIHVLALLSFLVFGKSKILFE